MKNTIQQVAPPAAIPLRSIVSGKLGRSWKGVDEQ
jgi:hypothetical protein